MKTKLLKKIRRHIRKMFGGHYAFEVGSVATPWKYDIDKHKLVICENEKIILETCRGGTIYWQAYKHFDLYLLMFTKYWKYSRFNGAVEAIAAAKGISYDDAVHEILPAYREQKIAAYIKLGNRRNKNTPFGDLFSQMKLMKP